MWVGSIYLGSVFFLMIVRPPRSTRTDTLFPYPTLFRSHVVVQRLAFVREATAAVGHHALALGRAHRDAEVGLAGPAELALAAFGGVQRDHVVAGRDAGHALAHFHHHARPLVAQHPREQSTDERRVGKVCVSRRRSRWSP